MSSRKTFEVKNPQVIPVLGMAPDVDVARAFGCTPPTIAAARKRLGIPRFFGHRDEALTESDLINANQGQDSPPRVNRPPVGWCFVAFGFDPDTQTMNLLNSYDGIRAYPLDAVDPRCTMGLTDLETEFPYFERFDDAMVHLLFKKSAEHTPCRISLAEGWRVFGKGSFWDVEAGWDDEHRPQEARARDVEASL